MKKPKIGNMINACLRGELLLWFQLDKYLPHVAYLCFLGFLSILASYHIEMTLLKVEDNKEALETIIVHHAQKTCEAAGMDCRSTVEVMLKEIGSEVQAPDKPAMIIKTR